MANCKDKCGSRPAMVKCLAIMKADVEAVRRPCRDDAADGGLRFWPSSGRRGADAVRRGPSQDEQGWDDLLGPREAVQQRDGADFADGCGAEGEGHDRQGQAHIETKYFIFAARSQSQKQLFYRLRRKARSSMI